ncbi:Crossover junction endonuclease MUS81-like [Homarus americanus]|uniref:Crossover junction endonuclease MUS81 n=1 Tax=Homarus americanus TaxID=6706 RepID=A0A8J5JZW1_HOMAM|nr:Crossover junction endonuclease MUS81-like [Homarus americanus]
MNKDGRVLKRKKYRRIKRVINHPNSLFDKWLQEWQADAELKNSNMKYNYQRARKSLRLFPLPLYSGKDCKVIANFGEKICEKLDRHLQQHTEENGPIDWDEIHKVSHDPPKKKVRKKTVRVSIVPEVRDEVLESPSKISKEIIKKKRKVREYVPAARSGAYALLVALFEASKPNNFPGYMKKTELMEVAQPLCDASFTHASEGSRYTAWSCMSTLIKKELVTRESSPARYSLTPEGEALAAKLMAAGSSDTLSQASLSHSPMYDSDEITIVESRTCSASSLASSIVDYSKDMRNVHDNLSPDEEITDSISNFGKRKAPLCSTYKNVQVSPSKRRQQLTPPTHQFMFLPREYEIVLCIDNAETSGGCTGGKRSTKDIIIKELDRHGIKYDVRKLHIGDFLWKPRELVLPYIIERKRMDDLASSIKDGRFREQKFRLKKCGLTKPMYLVVDGFDIKVTKDQRESAAFLTIMTRCIQSKYQGKTVSAVLRTDLDNLPEEMHDHDRTETSLMTFTEFNAASVKNRQLTVREMFAKHLLQFHGLSVDKARAIVDKYGTPGLLMSEYDCLRSPGAAGQMLASIKCGKAGRNLGPTLSANIAKLYTRLSLQ